jgi:eukaryotic-like serine/threonine-protein kinase
VPAERWRLVSEVFQAALDRPAAERATFLASACGDDEDLRLEVQSLLDSHVEAGAFLSDPAALPDTRSDRLPSRIGAYAVEGTIGHGGMGTVYRAVRDDDAFRKTVALKLTHGGIHSACLERRFLQERKILARLQHPHIAMVLDGGTTPEGQPYLVMEHVEGQPITEYCTARALGLRERLALFRTVCGAVQYAHQNLVIHRDLKPDNILVTPEGVPKLLDFGIAKLLAAGLDPEDAPTATVMPMMTPHYASPEQVRGDAVTTASDVYSLGVLLYELLAGRRPYTVHAHSLPDILRIVCETEPPLPSAAAAEARPPEGTTAPASAITPAALRGDLDTIVMKALRKEPSRRYAGAQEISADIDRHLRDLPVLARPDTVGYRGRKFVARHKAGVTASALVLASLIGAVVVSTRQARIARQHLQDTRQLANVLLFEAYDSMRYVPGTTAARTVLVRRGLEYHDRLAAEPEQNPLLRLEHSTAYVKMGDLFRELGDSGLALDAYGKALAMRERLAAEAPSNPRAQQQVATAHNRMGALLRARGNLAAALDHHREALRIAEQAARALGDAPSRRRMAVAHHELAYDLLATGQAAEAASEARAGVAVTRQILQEKPSQETRNDYAALLEPEADAAALRGDHVTALARLLEMDAINRDAVAAHPENVRLQIDFVTTLVKVGARLASLGRAAEAAPRLAEAVATAEAMMARGTRDAEARLALADAEAGYANLLAPADRAAALARYEKATRELRELQSNDRFNMTYQDHLGTLLLHQAEAQRSAGLGREATASLEEGAALAADLRRRAPAVREHQVLFARARFRQGLEVPGARPRDCGPLRQAAAVWASLASRGPLNSEEAAESLLATTMAGGCPQVAGR